MVSKGTFRSQKIRSPRVDKSTIGDVDEIKERDGEENTDGD